MYRCVKSEQGKLLAALGLLISCMYTGGGRGSGKSDPTSYVAGGESGPSACIQVGVGVTMVLAHVYR